MNLPRSKRYIRMLLGLFSAFVPLSLFLGLGVSVAQAQLKIESAPFSNGRLAFTYVKGKSRDVYVLDFELNTIRAIIDSEANEQYPSWSPYGTELVFQSDKSGRDGIYRANFDGSNQQALVVDENTNEQPHWRIDGKQIAFTRTEKGSKSSAINLVNADGSSAHALFPAKNKTVYPKWSPRGDELVYTTNQLWPGWDIVLFDTANKKAVVITSGVLSYSRADWSPDGSAIVFSAGLGNEMDLWIKDKGGTPARQLTKRPGREYDAVWSDDGQTVFFVAESTPGKGDFQIYSIRVSDRSISRITSGPGAIRHLSWTPLPALPAGTDPGELKFASSAKND